MNIRNYCKVDVAVIGTGTAAFGAISEVRRHTERCVLVDGCARFLGPNHLYAKGRMIEAGATVVATDDRTQVPEDWERFADGTLSAADLDDVRDLPGSVAVVGLGPSGLALAQRLVGRGVEVIGFERAGRLSAGDDPAAACGTLRRIRRPFRIVLGHDIGIQRYGKRFRVRTGAGSAVVDKLLFATGWAEEWIRIAGDRIGSAGPGSGVPGFDPETLRIPGSCVFVAGTGGTDDEGRLAGFNAVRAAGVRGADERATVSRVAASGRVEVGVDRGVLDPGTTVQAQAGSAGQGQTTLTADTRTHVILGGILTGPGCELLAHVLHGFVQQQLTVRQALYTPCCQPKVDAALRSALLALQTALDATPVVPDPAGMRHGSRGQADGRPGLTWRASTRA